jgi:cupin 2 domain-containing protein
MVRYLRKKEIIVKNIFDYQQFRNKKYEVFENIIEDKDIKIERIISSGQITPKNKWLKDSRGEWVILLRGKAELLFKSEDKLLLKKGDYLLIPSNTEHKVTYTSKKPHCIWLAIYGNFINH